MGILPQIPSDFVVNHKPLILLTFFYRLSGTQTASTGHVTTENQGGAVLSTSAVQWATTKFDGVWKNGHIHNGKQNHHCHHCGRQFVQCREQYLISDDKRGLIERVLVERISLRGICRAVGVTLKWLLGFLVECGEALPDHLHVQPLTGHGTVMLRRLEVEADERASFVPQKANKQGLWIAMDATT